MKLSKLLNEVRTYDQVFDKQSSNLRILEKRIDDAMDIGDNHISLEWNFISKIVEGDKDLKHDVIVGPFGHKDRPRSHRVSNSLYVKSALPKLKKKLESLYKDFVFNITTHTDLIHVMWSPRITGI